MIEISEEKKFIELLKVYLNYTKKIHTEYMNHGKKFVYAKILHRTNKKIRKLIEKNLFFLSIQKQKLALDLLFHIEVWETIWTLEYDKQSPDWNDSFTFESENKFPRESTTILIND